MSDKKEHSVIVYSTATCMYCKLAKEYFDEHNVKYTPKDVGVDMEARKEMFAKTGGPSGVPVIDIDGTIVVGFDEERLAELLGI